MKKTIFLIGILLIVSACTNTTDKPTQVDTPFNIESGSIGSTPTSSQPASVVSPGSARNVILLIGDGMGAEQRKTAQWVSLGMSESLVMDKLPVNGWIQTASLDNTITDSAASATAYATGQTTYNNFLSIAADGNSITTILEYAQQNGMSVGLITTKYLADATPGAFAVHIPDRVGMRLDMASQMLEHDVDVLMGGGESDFLPGDQTGCHPNPGNREDGRNLVDEAIASGYTYVCDQQGFSELDLSQTDQLLGLFADDNMERPNSPSLPDMTRAAIEILSRNPNGFFLMSEGGLIDMACHYNDAENAISDTVEFDEAVAVALDYANSDGNTLVIVTADHETGGMTVTQESSGNDDQDGPFIMPDGQEFFVNWTSVNHTGADVPVTAFGPDAEKFSGTNRNTFVFDVMANFLQIDVKEPELANIDETKASMGSALYIIQSITGEITIDLYDDFESFDDSADNSANTSTENGRIMINGTGNWGSYWKNFSPYEVQQGSLVKFRLSQEADFVLGYDLGTFSQPDYCSWGANEFSELYQWSGGVESVQPLDGFKEIESDKWYYGLYIIDKDDQFMVRIWEANFPAYHRVKQISLDTDFNCAVSDWQFTAGVNTGSMEIDDYYHFSFGSDSD
ncbi:alkaline phosphatase [Chloroflexota bacterium]